MFFFSIYRIFSEFERWNEQRLISKALLGIHGMCEEGGKFSPIIVKDIGNYTTRCKNYPKKRAKKV